MFSRIESMMSWRLREGMMQKILIGLSFLFGTVVGANEACQEGLQAFQATVQPLVRSSCVHCHEGVRLPPANVLGPLFAVEDSQASYSRVLSYVDFRNIDSSLFVRKGGNNHCDILYGFDCGVSTPEPLARAVRNWWDQGQRNCPEGGNFVTRAVNFPSPLPTRAQGFTRMRFPLDSLGVRFASASFEIDVQRFSETTADAPGSYRFMNPRIRVTNSPIRLKGIRVLLNGHFDPLASEYQTLERTIASAGANAPFPTLSVLPLIVLEDRGPAEDLITVSFDEFEIGMPTPGCRALAEFQTNVMPTLANRSCFDCHGGGSRNPAGNPAAMRVLNLQGDDAAVCAQAYQRLDFLSPAHSVWVRSPYAGFNGHARMIPSANELAPWLSWIELERSRR